MTKKEKLMNNTTAEIKAVAKAITASLKRQGYATAHSAVLHALASAMNKRNWHILSRQLTAESAAAMPTEGAENDKTLAALSGPEVPARFYTDCHTFEVTFDARVYLQQASDEVLRSIMCVGYGGDCCTDNVAEYLVDHGLNEELQEAFDFLRAVNRRAGKDPTGSECQLDGQAYLRWMKACRPQVLALYLCKQYDVDLMQAEEEEIRGMWDWGGTEGDACEHAFDTREEAALDACEKLNLFEQELEACGACR